MRLLVDAKAWADLDQIGAWIAKDDPCAARAVLRRILDTIAQLERFPRLSRVGRVQGTRERIVPHTPYIVVFELWNDHSVAYACRGVGDVKAAPARVFGQSRKARRAAAVALTAPPSSRGTCSATE